MADLRPLMFSIAYRMLGSVTEAEDVIQEALLRMHVHEVHAPPYAVTVTTRLAIDHLRAAKHRREVYTGTWLPEPLAEEDPIDRDAVDMAFLLTLERLGPVERAVFLLREVFAYDYERIAEIVGKTPVNCRQILARAKARVRDTAARGAAHRGDELAKRFFAACQEGDLAGLEVMLAEDITFRADGGGKAPAVLRPVVGRVRVARFLVGLFRARPVHLEVGRVNGQPGARLFEAPGGGLVAIVALHVVDARVREICNVMNPEKLERVKHGAR